MGKSKKISFTSIAIVVLAILLTISLTMGGTLAWFSNQNQAGTDLTMGNAVGVAVVDATGSNGSMDKLSFVFNTGRGDGLLLPGAQVDPDVEALIAKSGTNTILRAVVTFEVTVKTNLIEQLRGKGYTVTDDGYMTVPSSISADSGIDPDGGDELGLELWALNELYAGFFDNLRSSAVYNGWVYRENNTSEDNVYTGSSKAASTKYYVAGATQYANQPLGITRKAGYQLTQDSSGTYNPAESEVNYSAFYFRGWSGTLTYTAPGDSVTGDEGSGTLDGTRYVSHGLDGTYKETWKNGSLVSSVYDGGGRAYYPTRREAAAGTSTTEDKDQYAVLEGTYDAESGSFTRTADPLGYRAGDPTDGTLNGGASADNLGHLNVATESVNTPGDADTITGYNYSQDGWMNSGVQTAQEDMMCVIDTKASTVKIPLFTTSFQLPTTWTQEVFADRSMRLNLTFQVMQADYLASGVSHHVSVELAESRFDDVTVWASETSEGVVAGQPYVKDVNGQPNFNDPEFWPGDYKNQMRPEG